MTFFEPESPIPNFPDQPMGPWAPPAWDRPSEGTLPAIVPVEEIVHRSGTAVVGLELLRVYPNGFSIDFTVMQNPNAGRVSTGSAQITESVTVSQPLVRGGAIGFQHRFPRVGVRFSDGRMAGREDRFGAAFAVEKDDEGIPTQPIIAPRGGGGGQYTFAFSFWVFPLPTDGPLEIFTAFPADGETETKTVLDGTAIRAAAERAQVIWS